MPIHHAVLSLLAAGDSYGYELKGAFERSVGPQWGPLNIGHVYQLLERLKRDGLVSIVRSEPQPNRPDRLIYAITPAGREELARWLAAPSSPGGYRDELYLKLMAGARAGADTLRAVVRAEREALLGELHALRAVAAAERNPAVALLVEGAAAQVDARLRLLDRAEEDATALAKAAAAAAPPAPLTAEKERKAG
jgi:DNA-binding PadR family transcriptional regulator